MGVCPFGPDGSSTANFGQRKLVWLPSPSRDVVKYAIYSAPSGNSVKFLSDIDAGLLEPSVFEVADLFVFLKDLPIVPVLTDSVGVGLPDGNWQFAICSFDKTGNFSDPHQSIPLKNVKIKFTPPVVPADGGVS